MKISNILKDLQNFKTIEWNKKEKKEICDYVEKLFLNTGFYIERFEKNWIYSIVISSKKSRKIDFLFSGHLDVVDADCKTWEYKEDEEYFYWRWVLDMKWADAVMILSFLENKDKILNSDKNFALMFTTDEELWWENWVEYLIKDEWYTWKMVYIPDTWAWMDKYLKKWKWFLFWKFIIKWQEAHWCRPWKWKSSIDIFHNFYNDLYKEFPKAKNDVDWWEKISVNIWKINWWFAVNQVMNNLEIETDIRFNPNIKLEEVEKKINKILKKHPEINFEKKFSFSWFKIDENSLYIKKYLDIVKKFYSKKIKDEKEYGSNDWRFFTNFTQDIIMTWPFWYWYHWKNEKVSKKELENFKNIFDSFILKLSIN